jgi:Flagellar P-ring protein
MRNSVIHIGLGVLAVTALALGACGDKKPREAKPAEGALTTRDVPSVFRGTIGAEATIAGVEPTLVSGLGIVVGLNGTGGGELPVAVQATMERELARGGIGKGGPGASTPIGPVSPQEFLRSRDVAVVIVQASIPPGAPKGTPFDVLVRTLPGSGVTSLEGGTLWTTELRFGEPAVFGAVKTRKIGEARGPVFINPFTGPTTDAGGQVQMMRTVGRVLGGGRVTDPLLLELTLDNDSHARARSVVAAINSRFPREPGDEQATARGRGRSAPVEGSAQSIAVGIPGSYRDRPAEFMQLLRFTRIDQTFPEEFARQAIEELKSQPALSEPISWYLQAIGRPAIPFVATMYEYPEIGPRLAALEAGARLGDARAVTPLVELAKTAPAGLRTQAIKLLGNMPGNPAISLTLRELVEASDLDVRIAAYEGLRERNDAVVMTSVIGADARNPSFELDVVPVGEPLIYVTQQARPRVVLFGADAGARGARALQAGLALNRPMTVSAWDSRLLMASDGPGDPVRVMYRDPRTGRQVLQAAGPEKLAEMIRFMAQKPRPEDPSPGLGFGYSEVVGALYELSKQGAVRSAFATEDDRLRAEVIQASQSAMLLDRPETSEQEGVKPEVQTVFKTSSALGGGGPAPTGPGETARTGKITRVVPLTPGNASPSGPKR